MLRMIKIAKDSAVKARTQAINQLRAVLARSEPALRESLAGLGRATLVRRCAGLPDAGMRDLGSTAISVPRSLAHRIHTLEAEIRSHEQHLTAVIESCAPRLLERPGVGADTAAAMLITAGDDPDRLTSEAAFAALCGVNPTEASSGKTTRHRLNRGGDRRSNSALYTVVLTRLGRDQRTRDYAERRTRDGKTKKEIIRCLKRYVAREISLNRPPASSAWRCRARATQVVSVPSLTPSSRADRRRGRRLFEQRRPGCQADAGRRPCLECRRACWRGSSRCRSPTVRCS
ncbi:transposase [Nocardia sp. GAS34]